MRLIGVRFMLLLLVAHNALSAVGDESSRPLFRGTEVHPPNERIQEQVEGPLRIRSAVPSEKETIARFGSNLYRRNVQPVWIEVRNNSDEAFLLSPMGLDPEYYSPRETAHRSATDGPLEALNKEFEAQSIGRLLIEPRSAQSGFVFTRVDEGTKSFNVDIAGDGVSFRFTFFIPVPGLKVDHQQVRFAELYEENERRDVELAELVDLLEDMPCCVVDASGEDKGDPLNLVLIGEAQSVYYAFLRAGWDETETINRASMWKTALSALTGGAYRYSPVSALYVFGRPQDIALQRTRESIHRRNHLRLWVTPFTIEGVPIWIGQISRDIGVRFTWRTITTHKIDPDVDETRSFLLEDLAYAEAVTRYSYVGGVGAASYDEPRRNLTGDPYFTDGMRLVMLLTDDPTPISELKPMDIARD